MSSAWSACCCLLYVKYSKLGDKQYYTYNIQGTEEVIRNLLPLFSFREM